MKNCYNKDANPNKKRKNCKLIYSLQLEKQLRNIYISEQFLENGGLEQFEPWLRKMEGGIEQPLTLKKKVLNIILNLNASEDHIEKASELKKIILKNKKNPLVKDLCQAIITKWGDNSMI